MTATFTHGICLAAALLAVTAGCSVPDSSSSPVAPAAGPASRVVLGFGDHAVTATLADTPASREFAAMLPLTVQLTDAWGQAKSGRLPHPLTVEGATPVHDPSAGDIYFWPQSDQIAVYYDDLGQAVPDPGLVRLGVVDTGLDSLAGAGRRVTVRIDTKSSH